MEIHHIRYFLSVCKTLNFTRAAEQSNVSQPALSRAIRQLEEEVGGLLLRRERNTTHLTDLGNVMKPHFEQILAGLADIKAESKRFLTLDAAQLKLGVMCTIGPTRFAGILGHFAQTTSGTTVQIIEDLQSNIQHKLESGECEVALLASPDPFPEQFDCQVLYRERFVVAFPSGHRFARMKSVPFAATDGENYLNRANCEFYKYLAELTQKSGAVHHDVYESEREDWIQNLVSGGMGICFLPEFSAVNPGIPTRPLIEPEVWRDVCVVTMAGKRTSKAVMNFVQSLRDIQFETSKFGFAEECVPDQSKWA